MISEKEYVALLTKYIEDEISMIGEFSFNFKDSANKLINEIQKYKKLLKEEESINKVDNLILKVKDYYLFM